MNETIKRQGDMEMQEIENIRKHPLFQEYYDRLEKLEEDRRFCRHQLDHLMDVARIAYIWNLEEHLGFRKEVIYAAALLHDIGKCRQYEEGIPHDEAGEKAAEVILNDLPSHAFSGEEKEMIIQAVRGHRKKRENQQGLERLLCDSDKKSRLCFACPAEKDCNWSSEKKNKKIEV